MCVLEEFGFKWLSFDSCKFLFFCFFCATKKAISKPVCMYLKWMQVHYSVVIYTKKKCGLNYGR